MRNSPCPPTYRTDPGITTEAVISAINGKQWDLQEWQSLRISALSPQARTQ